MSDNKLYSIIRTTYDHYGEILMEPHEVSVVRGKENAERLLETVLGGSFDRYEIKELNE